MRKWLKNNFEMIKKDGDWELFVNRPVYRIIQAFDNNYIFNYETGENCGQCVELHCTLFDENGNKLDSPIYEKNCYEIVELSND
jgi:hypothetical protein